MADTPPDPSKPSNTATSSSCGPASVTPSQPPVDFNIGEEFGTARRNLPPAGIVLICVVAVAIVVAVIAFQQRAKPQGSGSVDFVSAVDIPRPDNAPKAVFVAVTLTLHNTAEKSLWIRTLKAQLTTADGHTYDDEAASAVDLDRYFQAFPALKQNTDKPLSPETKLLPGTTQRGTLMFSFPVAKDVFDQRKLLTVAIQPYDQPLPIVLQ